MIPIRDTIPSKNYPVVNHTIIGINVVIYLFEMSQGADLNRFIYIYGLVPARYSVPQIASYFSTGQQLFSLFSFMFLHGGFFHLLGNMWFLYIFGDNIEDRLGPFRYIAFYLLCGITSGLSHLVLNFHSNMPTIGASGAIAGVMGAYLILHPNAKILTLIPIIIIPWFIEIPAFFFLGLWFVLQFLNATGSHGGAGGIAWWAHIGGFVFGIVFLKILLALPETGMTDRMRRVTAKRKTHRLQVIRPVGPGKDPHLYGTISVTSFEALAGTKKLVNIPWGFQKRIVKVIVPPGVKEGSKLRLKGLGKTTSDGQRGDLYLKVAIVN
ncbi:MAG: rhomboid family intramembrane serine protease [Desulfobacteraceae bacterium]|nr:rhomboid family intramembrane serine protease [Desulfobacteraceae bacterium]MDH3565802.1 rhomboid family intramembrane serine protease [Desulfobacteraceae bacterium]